MYGSAVIFEVLFKVPVACVRRSSQDGLVDMILTYECRHRLRLAMLDPLGHPSQ